MTEENAFARRPNLQEKQQEPNNYAGPRRFFQTMAGPDATPYPEDMSDTAVPGAGDVYWARMLRNVSFPEAIGRQTLDYDTSTTETYICNIEPRVYIPEGSICLCFRENGQWWTMDPLITVCAACTFSDAFDDQDVVDANGYTNTDWEWLGIGIPFPTPFEVVSGQLMKDTLDPSYATQGASFTTPQDRGSLVRLKVTMSASVGTFTLVGSILEAGLVMSGFMLVINGSTLLGSTLHLAVAAAHGEPVTPSTPGLSVLGPTAFIRTPVGVVTLEIHDAGHSDGRYYVKISDGVDEDEAYGLHAAVTEPFNAGVGGYAGTWADLCVRVCHDANPPKVFLQAGCNIAQAIMATVQLPGGSTDYPLVYDGLKPGGVGNIYWEYDAAQLAWRWWATTWWTAGDSNGISRVEFKAGSPSHTFKVYFDDDTIATGSAALSTCSPLLITLSSFSWVGSPSATYDLPDSVTITS